MVRVTENILINERRKRAEEAAVIAKKEKAELEAQLQRAKDEADAARKKESDQRDALTQALLKQVAAETAANIHALALTNRIDHNVSPIAIQQQRELAEAQAKTKALEEQLAKANADKEAAAEKARVEERVRLEKEAEDKRKRDEEEAAKQKKAAPEPVPLDNVVAQQPRPESSARSPLLPKEEKQKRITYATLLTVIVGGGILGWLVPHLTESNNNNTPTPPTPSPSVSYCASAPYDGGIRVGFQSLQATPVNIFSYNITSTENVAGAPWCDNNYCALPWDASFTSTPQGSNFQFNVRPTKANPINIAANSNVFFNGNAASRTPSFVASDVKVETQNGIETPAFTGDCPAPKPQANPNAHTSMIKKQIAKTNRNAAQSYKQAKREATKEKIRHQLSQGPSFFSNPVGWLANHVPGFSSTVDKAVAATGKKKNK